MHQISLEQSLKPFIDSKRDFFSANILCKATSYQTEPTRRLLKKRKEKTNLQLTS